jgi:hypothetical protein
MRRRGDARDGLHDEATPPGNLTNSDSHGIWRPHTGGVTHLRALAVRACLVADRHHG